VFSLYDSRLRAVADIVPARRGQLRMSACGPTVGRVADLGDLRTVLLPDLIRRNAERHGWSVLVCQNITGTDRFAGASPAENSAAENSAAENSAALRADCAALNIPPPDYAPRAPESADLSIEMIAKLIESGYAYATADGSVYFDARSFPDGGSTDQLLADQEPAEAPADWALWRAAPEGGELTWAAPWGTGFPSQDAQCSALALGFLGDLIDIHAGSAGARFPHYERERAQSDSLAGHEVVRHWVDGERVLFEDREMAAPALADVTARGLDPLCVRYAFLDHRYGQQLNLTWDALTAADGAVRQWRELVADWANEPSRPIDAQYWARITASLDEDLDTPAVLRALRELASDTDVAAGSKFETFAAADRVLALDLVSLVGRTGPAIPDAAGA